MRARWALAALLLASCGPAATHTTAITNPPPPLYLPSPSTTDVVPAEPATTATTLPPPVTTTTEAPTTTTEPPRPPATAASRSRTEPDWEALRQCESGSNYSTNTGNGYYGAYQFDLRTWQGLGYSGLPSDAAPSTQDEAAQRLYAARGASPWPVCGRRM